MGRVGLFEKVEIFFYVVNIFLFFFMGSVKFCGKVVCLCLGGLYGGVFGVLIVKWVGECG